jgi:transposase
MCTSLRWQAQPLTPTNGVATTPLLRAHATAAHGHKEWARDDDGDGKREVHINTSEGMWTDVRTFLRPFKGVNRRFLSGYIAMAEFRRDLKRVSPVFIIMLIAAHF